ILIRLYRKPPSSCPSCPRPAAAPRSPPCAFVPASTSFDLLGPTPQPFLPFAPLPLFHMSSMNSRFKSLGFGKRKSAASIQTSEGLTPSPTPPPGQIPQLPSQQQLNAPSIAPSSSTTSLPMNHPGPGNRPPSYTANFPPGQAPLGRTSPLAQQPNRTPPTQMVGGPPPINTGAPMGYPPGMAPMGQGPPPMGGPPGFGQQPPPPQG
ncbi:hsp70, partial [Fusarium pseudoanthophilum]